MIVKIEMYRSSYFVEYEALIPISNENNCVRKFHIFVKFSYLFLVLKVNENVE